MHDALTLKILQTRDGEQSGNNNEQKYLLRIRWPTLKTNTYARMDFFQCTVDVWLVIN